MVVFFYRFPQWHAVQRYQLGDVILISYAGINVKNGRGWGWHGHRGSIWTLPLSPQDILSHLNYFPGPRVGNLTPPPPKKKKQKKQMLHLWPYSPPSPSTHWLMCSTFYFNTPFLRRHPLQLIKTIPPHPTQGSTKCPGDSEKSEVKKLCLTRSQLIIL